MLVTDLFFELTVYCDVSKTYGSAHSIPQRLVNRPQCCQVIKGFPIV